MAKWFRAGTSTATGRWRVRMIERISHHRLAFLLLAMAAGAGALDAQTAKFLLVDIGHGNVAFVVSPSGETMLLDCGPPQAADRIYNFMQQNGIARIDYLVVSHFEADHMGAVAALSKRIPIVHYVDHGESVTNGKSDEW